MSIDHTSHLLGAMAGLQQHNIALYINNHTNRKSLVQFAKVYMTA